MELVNEKKTGGVDTTEKPVDSIINQLRHLISSGQLKPGDKLLSERKLAEKFGVGRAPVREAIKKLEFYGILKTQPQSGTFVAALETMELENLITDALQIETYDFYSLVETRMILEVNAIRLCCERRTDEDLKLLEQSMLTCDKKIKEGSAAIDEDLNFHRQIAQASKNQVLKSMMLIITPDIMTNYRKYWICDKNKGIAGMEHQLLFQYIKNQDADAAEVMMKQHLRGVMSFAKSEINPEYTKNIENNNLKF
ncbi:FadR/GntR family transcriptional regulator [Dysgonomonas sp. 511]|uniref:FadR/GntR family transcriptional regulator n=1 Tax=Dysgonomonas sp. 511 TaxID=2302930 RepID=UPI0013D5AAFF|nr:FadR/GntR family transcriptional regulator [Dysgonomonas sp. 511]NDV78153.1 FadR family transcriptional regulator [Dysgonomonas sp. 511]